MRIIRRVIKFFVQNHAFGHDTSFIWTAPILSLVNHAWWCYQLYLVRPATVVQRVISKNFAVDVVKLIIDQLLSEEWPNFRNV